MGCVFLSTRVSSSVLWRATTYSTQLGSGDDRNRDSGESKDSIRSWRVTELLSVNIECEGCNSSTSHCVPTAGGSVVCACLPGLEDLNPISPGQRCSVPRRRSFRVQER